MNEISDTLSGLKTMNPSFRAVTGDDKRTLLSWMLISGVQKKFAESLVEVIPAEYMMLISGGTLYDHHSILDVNEEMPSMLENGLLQVGHGPNGDPIVTNFKTEADSGYVSHDALYEDDEVDFSESYVAVSQSIFSMIRNLCVDPNFPADIHDADKYKPIQ